MRQRVARLAASAPAASPPSRQAAVLHFALGRTIFEKTAGGVGCAACHGMNANGGAQFNAPDIRGADEMAGAGCARRRGGHESDHAQ
jgi:cytochrome c553